MGFCGGLCRAGFTVVFLFLASCFIALPPARLPPSPDPTVCSNVPDATARETVGSVPREAEFDLVLHGATGFTGQITARYLASLGNDHTYAIAGRSASKLKDLDLSLVGHKPDGTIVADADDLEALRAMAKRARVVLAAAGPYQLYGSKLVQACAEVGAHYVDLSGEVHWQRDMIERFGALAEASGAKLVFAAGFDSAPYDIGAVLAMRALDEATGGKTKTVTFALTELRGAMSGGTLAAGIETYKAKASGAVSEFDANDPYLLAPNTTCRVDQEVSGWGAFARYDRNLGGICVPHLTATVDARVVRRSFELMGRRGVSYRECLSLGTIFDSMAFLAPYYRNGDLVVSPKPGEGPPLNMQIAGSYRGVAIAESGREGGLTAWVDVHGRGDPGYMHTSAFFAEFGRCLLLKSCAKTGQGGGALTTSTAVNIEEFVKRLEAAKHKDGKPLLTFNVTLRGNPKGGEEL